MANVVVYTHYKSLKFSLPGSFFDAFEYFQFAYQFNKDLQFYVFLPKDSDRLGILETINSRYSYIDLTNVHFTTVRRYITEFITKEFDKLFFFDLVTLAKLQMIAPRCNKIYYITEFTDKKYRLNLSNVVYLSEMPFCYYDYKVKLKFFFDIYNKITQFKNQLYVNYPRGELEEIKHLVPKDKPILFKQKKFISNLHEEYNSYLYIKSPYWFDSHPRLFHESYFYGKDISYINQSKIKDGSWYRYYDLMENGLTDRIMTKDDLIINEMVT